MIIIFLNLLIFVVAITSSSIEFMQEKCALPEGGRWCRHNAGFYMAVRGDDDTVSRKICNNGDFETMLKRQVREVVPQGATILDIGANLGVFSIWAAFMGYNVIAIEGMPSNVEYIQSSLCMNPNLTSNLKLLKYALGGGTKESCKYYVHVKNVGNGIICCPSDDQSKKCPDPGIKNKKYKFVENVIMNNLDDIVALHNITRIEFLKIDIEGSECIALWKGGTTIFTELSPRFVMSEALDIMRSCSVSQYLNQFHQRNYSSSKYGFPIFQNSQLPNKTLELTNQFENKKSKLAKLSSDYYFTKVLRN